MGEYCRLDSRVGGGSILALRIFRGCGVVLTVVDTDKQLILKQYNSYSPSGIKLCVLL